MAWGRTWIVLFISLASMIITADTFAETNEILAAAQNALMNAGIGLDTEEFHIDNLLNYDELPNAYKMVLESMLEEAKTCDMNERYRRADGVCNNNETRLWGAALQYQNRLLPNAYMDGWGIPRMVDKDNLYLPSARTVSVKCLLPNEETPSFLDKYLNMISLCSTPTLDN